MIELLLPGWLAGVLLATAAGPLGSLSFGVACPTLVIH